MTSVFQIGNIGKGVQNPIIRGFALTNATLKLDPYWFWYIQVASSSEDIAKGLSGAVSLPPANAMLFDMGSNRIFTVTCKDMLFPIGIVFFDDNFVVTEVVTDAEPGNDYTNTIPARYFLECNPNEAVGITQGLIAVLDGYIPPASPPSLSDILSGLVGPMILIMGGVMTMVMLGIVIPKIVKMIK